MVLESIIRPGDAEKKNISILMMGVACAVIAIVLSTILFSPFASLMMVFLTVMGCAHLVFALIVAEEHREEVSTHVWKTHSRAIKAYLLLFVGFVLAFSICCVLLPEGDLGNSFAAQHKAINMINGRCLPVEGERPCALGDAVSGAAILSKIIFNNVIVMIVAFFLSFAYGFGALIVITFNASVIGAAIGDFIRTRLALGSGIGLISISGYMSAISSGYGRYLLHGIPEITAYIISAIAGGILSHAICRFSIRHAITRMIMKHSAIMFGMAFLVVLVSGIIEVFVTPWIF